ncbi:hypothetical protein F4777DRAFT_598463 [Nemania sp. FL0916]|nr:hypothetical protein F4777DRAFT_598463 [Nemania sp. FL0916]
MSGQQDAKNKTPPKKIPGRIFNPLKDDPANAAKFVRNLYKRNPANLDIASTELAPLYGLGPNSSHDPLARMRAQSIFASPDASEPFKEFLRRYTRDSWGLPVADWDSTMSLVHQHWRDDAWLGFARPFPDEGTPEQHYARFLIVMLNQLLDPGCRMLGWLGDAVKDGREDDACWVLFHALMFIQLTVMGSNQSRATFKDRVNFYVDKLTGPGSSFESICRLIFAKKGLEAPDDSVGRD